MKKLEWSIEQLQLYLQALVEQMQQRLEGLERLK
jgi:hypothetical protein